MRAGECIIHLDQRFKGKESIKVFDYSNIFLSLSGFLSDVFLKTKIGLQNEPKMLLFSDSFYWLTIEEKNWMIDFFLFARKKNFICLFIRVGIKCHFPLVRPVCYDFKIMI